MSADPALGEYLPIESKIRSAKEDLKKETYEKNILLRYFDINYPNKYNEVYSNIPGKGGVYNVINLALYQYAGNNPLIYTDPTGYAIEASKVAGRIVSIATSICELGIGIGMVTSGVGGVIGVKMIVHGLLNTISSIYSLYEYIKSDGNNELSTSFAGVVGQTIIENILLACGVSEDKAKIWAGLIGSAIDLVDGLFSANLLGTSSKALSIEGFGNDVLKTIDVIGKVNVAADAELLGLSVIDTAEEYNK